MPAVKSQVRSAALSKPVEKKIKSESTLIYILGVALCVMLGAALAIWAHIRSPQIFLPPVEFTEFKSLRVHAQGYAMLASLSVQTSSSDSGWIRRNEKLVRDVLSHALVEADPKTLRTAEGLQTLQRNLANSLNATLPSARATQVLLTDFVLQEQDD